MISTYNNAGWGLWTHNLENYRNNTVVNNRMVNVVINQLDDRHQSHRLRLIHDLQVNRLQIKRLRRLSLHTRLVIRSNVLLPSGLYSQRLQPGVVFPGKKLYLAAMAAAGRLHP